MTPTDCSQDGIHARHPSAPYVQALDAYESTPEGCGTCHFACACREARMQEIVDAARSLLKTLRTDWHQGTIFWPSVDALEKVLRNWKS